MRVDYSERDISRDLVLLSQIKVHVSDVSLVRLSYPAPQGRWALA